LTVGKHLIDVWTDGSLLSQQAWLTLYLGFPDASVLDEGLTAEITCASIGAGRRSVSVPIQRGNLFSSGDYPGGLLVVDNCFAVDTGLSHLNALGKHDVVVTIRGEGGTAKATLPIEVAKPGAY
jgi:hypothetical protein